MRVACYAARVIKYPGYIQSSCNATVQAHRSYAQTNFDDIFVHSRTMNGRSDLDNHIDHLRAVLECMRTNKLYANASKCIFGAEEIFCLWCFICKRGL